MINKSPVIIIKTDKDIHFTGTIAQDAHETESIDLSGIIDPSRDRELLIEALGIQAVQNLEWDVYFWTSDEFDNADLDLDACLFMVNFPATSQKQIAGANQYYVDDTVKMPYPVPADGKIHISLCNRSATAKNAGATGEVVVKLLARAVR